jgi:outer membrane lipoprotein-sorting protein
MSSFRPLIALACLSVPALAAAQASPDLEQVHQHLRAVQTMTAAFVQTDSRGRSVSGTVQLKRPGRIRFEYQKGVPLLVVGDGKALTMIDYQVRQVSRWPIGNTPLALLLDPDRDMAAFAHVVPSGSADMLLIEGRDPKHREYGTITVAFHRQPGAPAGLVPIGWTVLDAQGNRTTVRLSDQRFNVAVDDAAFRWKDPRPSGPRK